MKRTLSYIAISACISSLLACSGDDRQTVDDTPPLHADVKFLYPIKNQQDVPSAAGVTLKTTAAIVADSVATHFRVTDSNGALVEGTTSLSDSDPTLLSFTPAQPFTAGATYAIDYDGLQTELGAINAGSASQFTVRKRHDAEFSVESTFPHAPFPFMDYGSVFLRLSQDIDPACVVEGDTVSLLDSNDDAVDIHIVRHLRYLTIDPAADLAPGATYKIVLDGVCSESGSVLPLYELSFTAEKSTPHAITRLNVTPSAPDGETTPVSALSLGQPVNSASMLSVFLGPGSSINLGGKLQAALAYLPDHPNYSPFVVRAGNVLSGTPLDVKLNGVVPSLLNSGAITLTLMSDAVGYMYRNPLAQSDRTTKAVIMTMDAALTATDPTVNASISQNTMHATITGNAVIEDGKLKIDATGLCELRLLNVTWATSQLALRFETPASPTPDDSIVYVPPAKTIALKTSYPEHDFAQFDPDDNPLLSFSDPIDSETVTPGESLRLVRIDPATEAEIPLAFTTSISGGNVYLRPTDPLPYGSRFRIAATTAIGDRHGNHLAQDVTLEFSTPAFATADELAPLVKGIFPGYACVLTGGDLANNDAGRCLGGEADDAHFDIFPVPADVDLRVFFSQPMLATSIVLGDTCDSGSFRVETIDTSGNCTGTVPGRLVVKQAQLSFTPDQPWQDGALYRMTLMSSNANDTCDAGEICGASARQLPLNTDPLNFVAPTTNATADVDIGGPPLVIPFRGIPAKNAVFTPLLARPYTDVNGNGKFDPEETAFLESYMQETELGATGIVSNFRIDCEAPPNCAPYDRTTFISNTLFVDVGEFRQGVEGLNDGIHVDVHPTILHLTSNTLYTVAAGLLPLEVVTGPQQLRVLPREGGAIPSRIIDGGVDENGVQQPPIFEVTVDAYYDAPYVKLLGGIADTSLKSLVVPMTLRGPITFTADGRMIIDLALANSPTIEVDIYLLTEEALTEAFGSNIVTQLLDAWLDANLGDDHKAGSISFRVDAGRAGLYLVSEPLQ